MVHLNDTIIATGGEQRNSTSSSDNTFLFDLSNKEKGWKEGPKLRFGRFSHSCGKIRTTQDGNEFSTIVVGGFQVTYLPTLLNDFNKARPFYIY